MTGRRTHHLKRASSVRPSPRRSCGSVVRDVAGVLLEAIVDPVLPESEGSEGEEYGHQESERLAPPAALMEASQQEGGANGHDGKSEERVAHVQVKAPADNQED